MSVKYKIRDQHGLNYLTCSIVGWVDLFSRQIYRDMLLDSWRYCQEHKGFQVHAYTIMSNHLHLIASCRAPHRLEATMRDWKHFTATKILDYLIELPEHWQYSSAPFYAANSEDAPFRTEPYQPLVEIVPIWRWFYEEGPGSG